MNVLAQIGSVIGCAGLALLFVARQRPLRIAGLVAWAVGLASVAAYLAPSLSVTKLAAAGVGGVLVAVAGGWALLRVPYLLPFATLACVPARIPILLGGDDANLLLPLYVVVASLAVALGWQLIITRENRSRELGPVAIPLAAFVAWTGLTLAWTVDLREGAIFVGAFILPFGLLALAFARLPWRGRYITWLWVALVGTALAFASIGAYQWGTRDVFWNPKVIVGNAYAPFFRVNSIFWDPSIYGRYLTIGILTALAGILLGGVRGWRLAGLYGVVAAMWVGLFFSFSQSSFVALAVGVLVAAIVIWGRAAVVATLIATVVVAALVIALPQTRDRIEKKSRSGVSSVTSTRSTLVGQGLRIALANPVGGVGVGGFKLAYAERTGLRGKRPKKAASHTAPVTIAAEEGLPGLVLFGWLCAAALLAALRGLGRGFTSRVSFAVGLTLVAIIVHSFFYSAFFEDPMTWAMLGLVGLAVSVPRKGSAS